MSGESGRLLRMGNDGSNAGLESVDVDTSGAVVTLDFEDTVQRLFIGAPVIDGNRTIALNNDAEALQLVFDFEVDGPQALEFPASFRMSDALWDSATHTWTSIDAGRYQASAFFDGALWNMIIVGAFV